MSKQLFIIAHTWQDTDLTIHTFHTAHKAVKKLGELVDDGFEKPNPDDDPLEYLERYRTWYQDERDNECENVIAMEVVDLGETSAPANPQGTTNAMISETSYNALVWATREFFEGLDAESFDKEQLVAAEAALAEKPVIMAAHGTAVKAPEITEADLKGEAPTRYAALRLWRKDRAQEADLPEFMIFHNKTLMEIAQAHPCTMQDLIKIKGVGDDKMRRYGDDVIAIMNAFN